MYLICGSDEVGQGLLNAGNKRRVLPSVVFEELAVRRVAQFAGQVRVLDLQSKRQTLVTLHYCTF